MLVGEVNFLACSFLVQSRKVFGGNYSLLLSKLLVDVREKCLGEGGCLFILLNVKERSDDGLGGKERDGIGDATMVFCCSEAKPPSETGILACSHP